MVRPGIIIRADASVEMGSGHIMRCIALAQAALKQRFQVTFIISEAADFLKSRLLAENINVILLSVPVGSSADAELVTSIAKQQSIKWIVIDGYHFTTSYQKQLKQQGLKILFVDDYGHCDHYVANYILNQNSYADETLYPSKSADTQLLIGPRYCLLRNEFSSYINQKKEINSKVKNVLLTFGGTDPGDKTIPALKLIHKLAPELERITILAGIGNRRLKEIKQLASDIGPQVTILANADNVPDLMAETDLAISAAGSTVWELLFMGVPSAVISVADNQDPIADYVQQNQLGISLERTSSFNSSSNVSALNALLENIELRKQFSQSGQAAIDGRGAFRVASCFDELSFSPASMDDCKWIWELANDPVVRQVSFASDPIPWEDHVNWYSAKIKQTGSTYWVAKNAFNETIGQVRFENADNEATISISLLEAFRGKGYGTRIIVDSCREFFIANQYIQQINASIKPDNRASIDAFIKAGFVKDNAKSTPEKLLFVKTRV